MPSSDLKAVCTPLFAAVSPNRARGPVKALEHEGETKIMLARLESEQEEAQHTVLGSLLPCTDAAALVSCSRHIDTGSSLWFGAIEERKPAEKKTRLEVVDCKS